MSNLIRIDTPESVDVALEPAGFGNRFLAALIDGLIQGAAVFSIALVAIPLNLVMGPGRFASRMSTAVITAILLVLLGLLFVLYKPLMEAVWNGQTIGKRVAGIRVVRNNGLPVGVLAVIIRNLLRVVDYLPFYYLIGAICIAASEKNQRLGDMAAGTVVVKEKKALVPTVPEQLSHRPTCNLNVLRQYVLPLSESDLVAARGYWQRRADFDEASRVRVAQTVAGALAVRMGWTEPLPEVAEWFIEEVLYVRAS